MSEWPQLMDQERLIHLRCREVGLSESGGIGLGCQDAVPELKSWWLPKGTGEAGRGRGGADPFAPGLTVESSLPPPLPALTRRQTCGAAPSVSLSAAS